jgi:hypothetical protein
VSRCQAHILTHCWVLQSSVSVALPGQFAESPEHVRVRVKMPPPHDTLQEPAVHSDHPDGTGSPCASSGGELLQMNRLGLGGSGSRTTFAYVHALGA